MQQTIVGVIILVAVIVLARRLYVAFRSGGQKGCGCSGCSNCASEQTCSLDQSMDHCPPQEGEKESTSK